MTDAELREIEAIASAVKTDAPTLLMWPSPENNAWRVENEDGTASVRCYGPDGDGTCDAAKRLAEYVAFLNPAESVRLIDDFRRLRAHCRRNEDVLASLELSEKRYDKGLAKIAEALGVPHGIGVMRELTALADEAKRLKDELQRARADACEWIDVARWLARELGKDSIPETEWLITARKALGLKNQWKNEGEA